MFSVIYCCIPIILFVLQLYLMKSRTSVLYKIKRGEICYNCKESLNVSDYLLWKRISNYADYSQLCVSCDRDKKLTQIKKPLLVKWKYNFLKFLINNSKKFNITSVVIILSLIISDLILGFFGYKFGLWIIYGTLNLIFYFISLKRILYTSIKKTSD